MQVQILGESWNYNNDVAEVEKLMEAIAAFLDRTGLYLSSIKVDAFEIFEDYHEYMIEHIREIERVEVVVHTIEEMTHQIIISTEQYLERAIPPMQQLSREFYQGPNGDSWDNMAEMIEGIQWIYQMIHSVVQANPDSDEWMPFRDTITLIDNVLPDLSQAIELKDAVSIADAMTYELQPIINDLYALIKKTIDDKVVRPHVN